MMDYNKIRRKTGAVSVGGLTVGGDAPISIQSMLNTPSNDYESCERQTKELIAAGCEIIRMAVPDTDSVRVLGRLKENFPQTPLVADIHFDYRLALECAAAGADKIRINPGNLGGVERVEAVAKACSARGIPIRIGVNGGSLERELLAKYGSPTPEAMAESALAHARLLENCGFYDIIISVKASDVWNTIAANRILAQRCEYPLHIGVTEAGTLERGMVKSAAAMGALLTSGIGDTVRISLTDSPVREVEAALSLLRALELRAGLNIVSCPTCGRTRISLIDMANEFERRAAEELPGELSLTVAIMGCVVNGPGEASRADIGLAGGRGEAVLFKKGSIIRKVPEQDAISELIAEIRKML